MGNTTKKRFYKPNSLTVKPPPGKKCPGLETDTIFYNVDDNDNSSRGYEAAILVKLTKTSRPLSKTFKNMCSLSLIIFPIIYLLLLACDAT